MQPRSWSPFSFFLCSYFPERVVASCCFGLKILSVYSPCTMQQWTFFCHIIFEGSLSSFPSKNVLVLCSVSSISLSLLNLLPSFSTCSLSFSTHPRTQTSCQTQNKRKISEANSQGGSTESKVRTYLLPNQMHSAFPATFPPLDFTRSSLYAQGWSVNRTHSTVLNRVRAIQPFLAPHTSSNPFPKMRHPWSAVPGLYEHEGSELSRWKCG